MARLLIVSDLHFASAGEKLRQHSDQAAATTFVQKLITRTWGHYFWLRCPCDHNLRLGAILAREQRYDWLVANGDYTVDNAFVGVSDDASYESAAECLSQIRAAAPGRNLLTIGDHDLGKKSLFGGKGGLRIRSLERMTKSLGVSMTWSHEIGPWLLIGITSSVAALPVFAEEILPEERQAWNEVRERLFSELRQIFGQITPAQRMILFVHDPSALPALFQEPCISARHELIEATVIGHLHSPKVLFVANRLRGIPTIGWLGHTTRRYTRALSQARYWRDFKVVLCPSPTGMQIFKDGGYLTLHLPESIAERAIFERKHLAWSH